MVTHIEQTWHVSFEPHEVDKHNLDTLDLVVALLSSKTKL